MFRGALSVGDRVGIKDSAEFTHWSRRGVVVSVPDPDAPGMVGVALDDQPDAVPVLPELIVWLGAAGEADDRPEWMAQAFPVNGDPPGMPMFFTDGQDVLDFAQQFSAAKLDEMLKVRPPEGASEGERQAIRNAGAVEF